MVSFFKESLGKLQDRAVLRQWSQILGQTQPIGEILLAVKLKGEQFNTNIRLVKPVYGAGT